ncbi:NAD(P)-binding domain-containing protein [Paracoccus caeni]|uniref:Pyrroline-5-carboxylate reductase n=1 Tax=Paracoccus caeni TaxID=657651 RepID=A0A934VWG0_9RHOB|nr:pyrroline-5-carboxylate reductase dimerization domain-containing protein [Paracoccus caeni]MBK4218011.1 NAD(P)-binding domain-containing protein [Paracoccus caeni]
MTRIGIIGGTGWLGSAIARRGIAEGVIDPARLWLSSRSPTEVPQGAHWTDDNATLIAESDLVVLSVRPAQFRQMQIDLQGRPALSVMAGVSATEIARATVTARIIRALPNAMADSGMSWTPYWATDQAEAPEIALTQSLFTACGTAERVEDEAQIDYAAALTGSGTAFPALFAQAMIDHAIAQGMPEDRAARAVLHLLTAASQQLQQGGESPAQVVKAFTDYAGTTAAGLNAMKAAGFTEAVHAGLSAAAEAAKP